MYSHPHQRRATVIAQGPPRRLGVDTGAWHQASAGPRLLAGLGATAVVLALAVFWEVELPLVTMVDVVAGLPWLVAGAGLVAVPVVLRRLRQPNVAGARPEAREPAFTAELAEVTRQAAVLVRTPDGTIQYWSPGCERLFGYAAAEAIGHKIQELLGTRYPPGGQRGAQEVLLRDGAWQGELRHRRKNGEPLVVAAEWFLRREGDADAAMTIAEIHADGTALRATESALRAGEARLLLAQEVAGVETWEWDAERDEFSWAGGLFAQLEATRLNTDPRPLESFLALVHPDDREAVHGAAHRALETGEYEAEFRVLRAARDGSQDIRWLIGRGRRMPGPAGRLGPLLGVHMDITARKEAEERQTLLMREVDHRAKNALAVVQAVLRLTRAETPEAFAQAISGRVAALARAQTLLAQSRWVGADLESLARGELAAFIGNAGTTRVVLEGPAVTVTPMAAQPLSMALHELATNSAKYGCLSVPGGALALTWSLDLANGSLALRWTETGGPSLVGRPATQGFGTRMIRSTIQHQLGGEVGFTWQPDGLVCDIRLPFGRGTGPAALQPAATPEQEESWLPS